MEKKERMRQIPEASLARTLAHHRAIGSTPLKVLENNPGKTLAETMTDKELEIFIKGQIDDVRKEHLLALEGGEQEKRILRIILSYLAPNVDYLRKIKRLPAELVDFDPKKEFSVPK